MRAPVAGAMIRHPKVCGPATTTGQAREWLRDDHVHAVLVVDAGQLVAVVERSDLTTTTPSDVPARLIGRLRGRVIGPGADLEFTRHAMLVMRRRRLAVIDHRGMLLGLLCLKRTGDGFCSDADVQARIDERRGTASLRVGRRAYRRHQRHATST
jgi:CBS-domain-containing membrane protein